ncbi:hypothetical protein S83_031895 [Arachis hypogaea]|nr:uncharacterized protein DS421_10g299230 [Arachis hypogaea]
MKKLCPNLDREDGLETVLEVPIPEEILTHKGGAIRASWQNMKSWMKQPLSSNSNNGESRSSSMATAFGGRNTELQLLLGVVGAPLIPSPISSDNNPITRPIKDQRIEASMAEYIVKQYVAAVGGERAVNSVESMYAMGQVRMATTEFSTAGEGSNKGNKNNKKIMKMKKLETKGKMGGFVMWQKSPELWCLELVVSGCKISAGSDGKVAWRQTPWHHSHASRGPPRPLRRFLQGLDPRSTANLFSNSICIGEKTVNMEDCFILRHEAETSALQARSNRNVEIVRHTVWGYFSQRTGLLVQLEDSHLLKLKTSATETIYWETNMESLIQDYRAIDAVQIAHCGTTQVSLFRFGEGPETHSRTRMEESWQVEEVDFNVQGLSLDCFLPPSDLRREEHGSEDGCGGDRVVASGNSKLPYKIRSASFRISTSKVAAVNMDDDDSCTSDDESNEEEL